MQRLKGWQSNAGQTCVLEHFGLHCTHNGYTVVVDVCSVVELLLKLRVLVAWPGARSALEPPKTYAAAYSTPPGCSAVLLTRSATIVISDGLLKEEE